MPFNSIDFAVFLTIVFILHWFVMNKTSRAQNILLLIASYIFYGWWDWRFLLLIAFSSAVDYFVGLGLSRTDEQRKRKALLLTSILVNLGLLGVFKYFNFFIGNLAEAFRFFGHPINTQGLDLILPVGISFYTFQTLSYTIDIYNRKLEPTKSAVVFFTFVSFFPQLVAGPIERAKNLLPQFCGKRMFDYGKSVDGMRQVLWGFFKKLVIADNCAEYVGRIFSDSAGLSGSVLLLGALLFSFQIYCDFSGYSDIAIGTARLFNIDLMRNFAFPLFSRDIAEFWRRWHISLTSWFKDYVYIPLGGNNCGTWRKVRNVFVVFILSGFWHGADWKYIIWGALHAVYFLPLLLFHRNRMNLDIVARGKCFPTFTEFFSMCATFGLTSLTLIFFRAENTAHAMSILSKIFSASLFTVPGYSVPNNHLGTIIGIILFFIFIEWAGREDQHAIARMGINRPRILRWSFYALIIFFIGMFMQTKETPFIYFQF